MKRMLALLVLAARTHAGDDALVRSFREYLREESEAKRERIWKGVEAEAKGLPPSGLEAAIRAAVPGEGWTPGFTHDLAYRAGGETWTYSACLPEAKPEGLIPLVIDPGHASLKDAPRKTLEEVMSTWLGVSGAGGRAIYLRTRVLDALSRGPRYEDWCRPVRKAGEPCHDTLAAALLGAVRDASMRWPVDPDRIYVHGLSQTGYWTWYLGAFAPDRFAAVAPVSAVTWQVKALLPSFRATPVFILHGTEDPTCPFAQAKEAAEALAKLGAPVDFRPAEGGKHVEGVFPRWRQLGPDLLGKTRDPYPKRIERLLGSGERGGCFWLEAEGVRAGGFDLMNPPCRIAGTLDGQTIAVEARGCARVHVLLSTGMLDLDREVTITLNGKPAFKGRPRIDPRRALDLARQRGDGGAAYPASVTLKP